MAGFQEQVLQRQAQSHLQSGDLAAAETICHQLLKRNKRDVLALQILGAVAFQRGRFDEATGFLDRCVAMKPRDPDLQCNYAKAWVAGGHLDKALAAFDKALRVSGEHTDAIAGKADLLERRGDDEPARAMLARVLDAGRETASMAVVAARLEQKQGNQAAAIEIARRHLDRPDLPAGPRRQLGFIMGWALEREGRIDEAFQAYRQANEIGRQPYNGPAVQAHIDRLISVFSGEALASMPMGDVDGGRAVFIVGMPRSGSTLIERIIDAHPAAHGAGELRAMSDLVASLVFELRTTRTYPDCIAQMTAHDAGRLGRGYLEQLSRHAPADATRVADKSLDNYTHLGLISRLVPGARVVHARRDPLDTCLSCYAQLLSPRKHAFAADLEDLGLAYRLYQRLMDHWKRVLDVPWLDIDYESLVADQETQSRRLIDFLGLNWDEACLRFHESERDVMTLSYAQVRRPLYLGSVGRATRFERHLGPLREQLGKDQKQPHRE